MPLTIQQGDDDPVLITSRDTHAGPRPMLHGRRLGSEQFLVTLFIALPTLAVIAAVPFAWGWGLTWTDIGLAVFFYLLCGLGVTAGFHRYFTHRAFKANRALRIALAVAGSMAFQGSIITLGRRSSPPPHLHRQRGRSAFTVAFRYVRCSGGQGLLARPSRLVVRQGQDQYSPFRPRPTRGS